MEFVLAVIKKSEFGEPCQSNQSFRETVWNCEGKEVDVPQLRDLGNSVGDYVRAHSLVELSLDLLCSRATYLVILVNNSFELGERARLPQKRLWYGSGKVWHS